MTTVINDNSIMDIQRNCFVCDIRIRGKFYNLANCRTQRSRVRVIEKLGELIDDRYMVIITEDDLICRSCANLVNTLDRLQTEMTTVRTTISRFLEQKYSPIDDELTENPAELKKTHIESSETTSGSRTLKRNANLDNCQTVKKQKKENLLKCDKCKYTTCYNAYMIHHIREHIKDEAVKKDPPRAVIPQFVDKTYESTSDKFVEGDLLSNENTVLIKMKQSTVPSSSSVAFAPMITQETSTPKQLITLSDDGSVEIIPWSDK